MLQGILSRISTMQHEHHSVHPEDISPLEEFRVRMEADPEWAENFLSRVKALWSSTREVYDHFWTTFQADKPLMDAASAAQITSDSSPIEAGVLIGILRARLSLLNGFMSTVVNELSSVLGCSDSECHGHWRDFFIPPAMQDDEGEWVGVAIQGGMPDFLSMFQDQFPDGFKIVPITDDEDGEE